MPFIKDGRQLIRFAYKHGFALPAFNICSLEMAQGCVAAAQALNAPIILQTYQADLRFGAPSVMVAMVKAIAEAASVPVMLHLDHGVNTNTVQECLNAGYSSVMLDGGSLDFAALLETTRLLAQTAHQHHASFEVSAENFNHGQSSATDPLEAQQLLQAGADMVAVSVGSEHGQSSSLDLGRLEQIATLLQAPLVLHGGSGIAPADVQAALGLGVVKINIGSALYRALLGVWESGGTSHRAVYQNATQAVCEVAKHYIQLLRADTAPAWREL
jgi:fructose-bisphosphate aldolase, class II